MKDMIPVNELARGYRLFEKEYNEKALEVLRSGWYVLGRELEAFEAEFAARLSERAGEGALEGERV